MAWLWLMSGASSDDGTEMLVGTPSLPSLLLGTMILFFWAPWFYSFGQHDSTHVYVEFLLFPTRCKLQLGGSHFSLLMEIIILMTWCIWKTRNDWIFNDIDSSVEDCRQCFISEFKLLLRVKQTSYGKLAELPVICSFLCSLFLFSFVASSFCFALYSPSWFNNFYSVGVSAPPVPFKKKNKKTTAWWFPAPSHSYDKTIFSNLRSLYRLFRLQSLSLDLYLFLDVHCLQHVQSGCSVVCSLLSGCSWLTVIYKPGSNQDQNLARHCRERPKYTFF
jgi:hypothetical protein